jgi:arylsulfatase
MAVSEIRLCFSLDDKTNVGSDRGTPVSDDYTCAGSNFNGQVKWIQIDLGEDAKDADHLISPEDRYRIAMARQ